MRAAARLLAAVLVLAAVALAATAPAAAAELIHRYDQLVRVAKDGTLTVTETIRVRAEGRQIRHGIYRDFPMTFRDAGGALRDVTFRLLDVTRDGHTEQHHTERHGDAIRIYAGSKDVTVPPGDHTYVFRYETGRQIHWFDGKAELYWNVTGNFWTFPIAVATVRVELANGTKPLRFTAYTGRIGARGTAWRGQIGLDGALEVATTRGLRAGEGLTIVAALPPDAVEPPGPGTLLWYTLFDYRGWIFATLGFILVLGYYAWAWNAVGRDPRQGTIIPLFHPPPGISPALANYIRNWGLSRDRWRAFTAAALSLAVRGVLNFDQQGKSLILKMTGKAPAGGFSLLPADERAIVTWVDGQGGIGTIDSDNSKNVATLSTKFGEGVEGENRNRFFRKNFGHVIAGLVLTALVFAFILTYGGLHDQDIGLLVVIAVFGGFLGLFMLPVLESLFGAIQRRAIGGLLVHLVAIVIVTGVGLHFILHFVRAQFGELAPLLHSGANALLNGAVAHPLPLALVLGFGAVNGLFLYLLRAPTDLGRKVMDQLDGLRLYIETAETPRLNLQAPEFTARHFEELLPYAVALDAEKPWSDAFAAALQRAHPEDPDPMSRYRPSWTSSGSGWSSGNFGSSVASTVAGVSSALASAMPASSGSSGFSGGGGSGGGGGGGGGGGW